MKRRHSQRVEQLAKTKALLHIALGTLWLIAPHGQAATIDFESVPVGTVYGIDGPHNPNDTVLVENGIEMSLAEFNLLGEPVDFENAIVGGRYADLFPSTPLELNRISVVFNFAAVGFDVSEVTFDYGNLGGIVNFAVNGGPIVEPDYLTLLPDGPGELAADVTATVLGDTFSGVVTLTGPVAELLVGGEELYIDNVTALPEPTALFLLGLGGAALIHRRGCKSTSHANTPGRARHASE